MLIWQLFVYPILDSKFGTLYNLRLSVAFVIPFVGIFPYLKFLRPTLACMEPLESCVRALHGDGLLPPPWTFDKVVFWSAILFFSIIIRISFVQNYTTINLIISNTSPSNMIGATNGMSASFAAAARCAAPVIAGTLFAASTHFDVFPIDASLIFLLTGLLMGGLLVATFKLDRSVNERRATPLT